MKKKKIFFSIRFERHQYYRNGIDSIDIEIGIGFVCLFICSLLQFETDNIHIEYSFFSPWIEKNFAFQLFDRIDNRKKNTRVRFFFGNSSPVYFHFYFDSIFLIVWPDKDDESFFVHKDFVYKFFSPPNQQQQQFKHWNEIQ